MMRTVRPQRLVLWLAIAGVVLRGLIPAGFMPGWTGDAHGQTRNWLVICPAGELAALLPGAHAHHHGGAQGHDEHAGHILAEAHLSCPFAAAAMAALPPSLTMFPPPRFAAHLPPRSRVASVLLAVLRVLPPARAPPRSF